jgi:DNA repair protein RecO (recombination protein O)
LDAIILNLSDYKEHDALIKTLSQTHGLMTFIAKGLMKPESKNTAACQPFSEASLTYDHQEGRGLQVLHSASMINSHRKLREDLSNQTVMAVLVELCQNVLDDNYDPHLSLEVTQTLRVAMDGLENTDKPLNVLVFFMVRALEWLGIEPQVDECTVCGDTKINSISMDEGGFVCSDCQKELQSPLFTAEFLYAFRIVNKVNLTNVQRYLSYQAPTWELIDYLYDFMAFHGNLTLKSWAFLKKWSIIN